MGTNDAPVSSVRVVTEAPLTRPGGWSVLTGRKRVHCPQKSTLHGEIRGNRLPMVLPTGSEATASGLVGDYESSDLDDQHRYELRGTYTDRWMNTPSLSSKNQGPSLMNQDPRTISHASPVVQAHFHVAPIVLLDGMQNLITIPRCVTCDMLPPRD